MLNEIMRMLTDAERSVALMKGPAFRFVIPGKPATKGSWRPIATRTRVVLRNDNPRAAAWTQEIAWACKAEMRRHRLTAPTVGRVHLIVTCWMTNPNAMDLDKILRAILDALTGVLYVDDQQVHGIIAQKVGTTDHGKGLRDHVEETDIQATAQDWIEQPAPCYSERPLAKKSQTRARRRRT